MDNAVKEERKTMETVEKWRTKEEYLKAKKAAKTAVYFGKKKHRQSSLSVLTITVIEIAFLKWLKDYNETTLISKMKPGKAAAPSSINIEMIKAVGDGVIVGLTSLFNH